MYKDFLIELFHILAINKVNYLILRGYEDLPEIVHYDIDFAVINEKELESFFQVLQELSYKYNFLISRDVVRQGLLKVFLHFGNDILKVDVFCEFGYAGLNYIDLEKLFQSKRKLETGIYVPSLNYELTISLLKEILHNSRIRKDKVEKLRNQFDKNTFAEPFVDYFSSKNIKRLSHSLFSGKQLIFKNLSFIMRLELLLSNFKNHGILKTFSSAVDFLWIKYKNQDRYDNYILNLKEN
jgi:hypothetical protein